MHYFSRRGYAVFFKIFSACFLPVIGLSISTGASIHLTNLCKSAIFIVSGCGVKAHRVTRYPDVPRPVFTATYRGGFVASVTHGGSKGPPDFFQITNFYVAFFFAAITLVSSILLIRTVHIIRITVSGCQRLQSGLPESAPGPRPSGDRCNVPAWQWSCGLFGIAAASPSPSPSCTK